ncbi:MAG: UbiX family flavin prenyltransferase [Planctomycetaceae bacterium]|nr:UbiX family flavin prenyltransferase [Planctomycetaceae bacterium]
MEKHRIVVGLSGASGLPVALEVLRLLKEAGTVETHLVCSRGAAATLPHEGAGLTMDRLRALAHVVHDNDDIGAAIASGAFRTCGMVVVPCSMKTLAGVAGGYADTLLLRAADVCLKERRRLVLAVRETPLSAIHLRNMLKATRAGAIVLPLVLTYYTRPQSVQDMTTHMAGKILDCFDLAPPGFTRWGEDA